MAGPGGFQGFFTIQPNILFFQHYPFPGLVSINPAYARDMCVRDLQTDFEGASFYYSAKST